MGITLTKRLTGIKNRVMDIQSPIMPMYEFAEKVINDQKTSLTKRAALSKIENKNINGQNIFSYLSLGAFVNEAERKRQLALGFTPLAVLYMSREEKAYWFNILTDAYVYTLLEYNRALMLSQKKRQEALLKKLYALEIYTCLVYRSIDDSEIGKGWTPLAYMGFHAAKDICEVIDEAFLSEHQKDTFESSVVSRKLLTKLNNYRLYWAWAGGNGGLLDCILDMPELSHIMPSGAATRISDRINSPNMPLGYISWILYFTRFGIETFLLLKHGLGLSKEESLVPMNERFKNRWQERKFILLNDAVWGLVNLVSFFWLTTQMSKTMGLGGAFLNIGLMSFDLVLAWWQYAEAKTKANAAKKELKAETALLASEIEKLKGVKAFIPLTITELYLKLPKDTISEEYKNITQLIFYKQQLQNKEAELYLLGLEWQTENSKLQRQIIIAGLFMLAMVALYAPIFALFVPAFVVAAPWIALAGAILSVGLTIYETVFDKWDDVKQLNKKYKEVDKKLDEWGKNFSILEKAKIEPNIKSQRIATMQLEKNYLEKEKRYYKKLIRYRNIDMVYAGVLSSFIPVGIFIALALPVSLPAVIGIIATFAVLALLVKLALKQFKPEAVNVANIKLTDEQLNELKLLGKKEDECGLNLASNRAAFFQKESASTPDVRKANKDTTNEKPDSSKDDWDINYDSLLPKPGNSH